MIRTAARVPGRSGRQSGRRRAIIAAALAAVLGITWAINGSSPAAFAIDYPTWDDVQNAKSNASAAQAQVDNIRVLITQIQAEVERTQAVAAEKGQIAFEAEEVHQAKVLELTALQTQADEAAATAEISELRAGQWAAQLVRVGGDDPTLKLFTDGADADDVLTSIGVSARISQQAKAESDRATQLRNTAQSLSDQADVMRAELERLSAVAAAAFAEAQAANAAAAAALSEQQSKVPELEAQAAYLQGLSTETQAGYQAGVQKRLEEALAAQQAAIDWAQISDQGWVKPAAGRVTSPYGYSAGYSGHHNGTDLGTGCGAPIIAASSGTVTYAGWYGDLGNWVQVDHGGGVSTGYAHQSQIVVWPGQWVEVGQLLGYSGNTGYSFGCHLHFVVYAGSSRINPEPFMASRGVYF